MHYDEAFAVLGRPKPHGLDELVAFLRRGGAPLRAAEANDHPLFLSLVDGPVGLLIWPTPEANDPIPVVRQSGHHLQLVATSVLDALLMEVAEADASGELTPELLALANGALPKPYVPGSATAFPGGVVGYQVFRAGGNHSLYERLVEMHLAKGDQQAARVAAERSAGRFVGWGRGPAFRADLLARIGVDGMVKEQVIIAMDLPAWTMGDLFEKTAERMGWQGDLSIGYLGLSDNAEKLPLDRAAWRMDAATAAHEPWSAHRAQLADWFEEGQLSGLAAWARAVAAQG